MTSSVHTVQFHDCWSQQVGQQSLVMFLNLLHLEFLGIVHAVDHMME